MDKKFENGNLMLFVGGNILHVSNLKISSENTNKWSDNTNFEVTCDITDNTAIRKLFFDKVEGTNYAYQYKRLPRKLKKAKKKLEMCGQRRTQRMNYLIAKGYEGKCTF